MLDEEERKKKRMRAARRLVAKLLSKDQVFTTRTRICNGIIFACMREMGRIELMGRDVKESSTFLGTTGGTPSM